MKKLILYSITIILFIILFAADKKGNDLWKESKKKEALSLLKISKTKLEDSIRIRLGAVKSIEALFKIHPHTTYDEFSGFAFQLMNSNLPVRALQFADSETSVKYVFPPKTNEITIKKKMTLIKDDERSPYVKKAIQTKKLTIQGPFLLRQGGLGVAARNPIFRDNSFFGLAIGIYDITALFNEALTGIIPEELNIVIKDKNGGVIYGNKVNSAISFSDSLSFGNLGWTIESSIKKEAFSLPFLYRIIFIGPAASLILCLFFLLKNNLDKNRELEEAVHKKTLHLKKANENLVIEMNRRKKTEDELFEEKLKYQDLYDNAPVMLLEADPQDFKIKSFNKTLINFTGYEESELLNSAIFEFFTDSFSKEKIMSELSQKGEINDLEQKIIKKDKTPADTILTVKEVKNTRGDLVSIRASFLDISEKKKLENRLLQTNKMEAIGKLAGGIAHDFNNILSAIMGYSELSLYEIDGTHSLKSNLEEILKASTRAKGLIKQILSFSRNSQVIFDDIDIKALIFDSVSMLKGSIPPEISIKINAKGNDYKTAGDPIKIHQVLLNLITNSVSAIDREKGLIEITLEKIKIDHSNKNQFPEFYLGRYIRIIVKDNGTGIKSEDLKNIFDPYFSTKEIDKGTGLGLSVVHGIIKSHKGYITVYSEFNKGAEFHIYLPVTEKQIKIEKTYTAAPEGGNEKILLVDDEISILDLERKFLENIGYYVSCETNPLSAVKLISEEPDFFDLVITDITMPEMSGDILIEQIREIRPDIPVIVYTGFNEKMNQIKSRTEYFLMKPIDLKKLAVVIREAVTASNT